ncbi:MAG: hypothetical protein HY928_13100 [Elusimicrobia bacterium]|nr:hypothetical protein [Elusimicrobiota bacterium]
MGALSEAVELSGQSEEALLRFLATFLATAFHVPATDAGGVPKPLIVPVEGQPSAVAYATREVVKEELPTGAVLTGMSGDALVKALPPEDGVGILLITEDGAAMPLGADMVRIMRVCAERCP